MGQTPERAGEDPRPAAGRDAAERRIDHVSPRLSRRAVAAIAVAGLLCSASVGRAQGGTGARPRLVLALSGGGARGFAHVGVLRAFHEAGLPVDAVAATSMGAIVGGMYAAGRSPDEIAGIVRSMQWVSLFSGRPDRRSVPVVRRVDSWAPTAGLSFDGRSVQLPAGLLDDHRVDRVLIEKLAPASFAAGGDFDRLPVRFRAVAGDLATGERVVLGHGDLALAVRASMAIPLLFAPVEWEGRKLVDGMVVDNVPVDVARELDGAVVVAVDASSPDLRPEDYRSMIGVAAQVHDVLLRRRNLDHAAEPDVLVRPDLGRHLASDYSGVHALVEAGYQAGLAAVPAIRTRLEAAGVTDFAARPRPVAGPALEGAPVVGLAFEGNRRVSDALARRELGLRSGGGFGMARTLEAFDRLHASGLFEATWLGFEPEGDAVRLVVRVKDAAPVRAEVAVGYSEWEKARGAVRLRNLDAFGFGERIEVLLARSDARTAVEGSLRGTRLLVTGLGYRVTAYHDGDKPRFFTAGGDEVNRASFDRDGVETVLRSAVPRWGLLEAGLRLGRVRTSARVGVDAPEGSDRVGALVGRLAVDTLDDLAWPERGRRYLIAGEWNLAALGADRTGWRARVECRVSHRLARRLTGQADAFAGLAGGEAPVYDRFRLGGGLLPGHHQDQLKGAQAVAAAASLRYRVAGQLRVLARVGAGNVFPRLREVGLRDLRWGASAGLYHPSPLGPVSLELGVRRGGGSLAQLTVGWD